MIRRQLQDVIEARMFAGKAIIVIGARQVGKSTLFNMVLEGRKEPALQLNCDEPEVQDAVCNEYAGVEIADRAEQDTCYR